MAGYGPAKTGYADVRSSPYDGAGAPAPTGDSLEQFLAAMQNFGADGTAPAAGAPAAAGAMGVPGQNPGDVCQFFSKAGWCRWGDTCRFAHIGTPVEREICQFFTKAGWCRWGDQCRHAHQGAPSGQPPMGGGMGGGMGAPMGGGMGGGMGGEVCQFFAKAGWCKYGDSCRYIHGQGMGGGMGGGMGMGKGMGKGCAAPPSFQGGGMGGGMSGEVCNFFSKSGWCKYGDACKYVHDANAAALAGGKGGGAQMGMW